MEQKKKRKEKDKVLVRDLLEKQHRDSEQPQSGI